MFGRCLLGGIRPPAEKHLRFVHVVGAAPQLDVVHRGVPAGGKGIQVVKFQEGAAAAAAVGTDERTLAAVASPGRSPDGSGNVSCPLGPVGSLAWLVGRRPLALFGDLDQKRESLVEDRGHVTIGDLMTEQVLSEAQAIVSLLSDGEL